MLPAKRARSHLEVDDGASSSGGGGAGAGGGGAGGAGAGERDPIAAAIAAKRARMGAWTAPPSL